MPADLFPALQDALDAGDPASAFNLVAEECRASGNYALLFETRLMRSRWDLGLPLIQTADAAAFPVGKRDAYEQAMIDAAREAGRLYLAAGQIEAAYRYLRAVGETDAVVEAIDRVEPGEDQEGVIAIALQEGLHPAKGLELVLRQHGMCRAITTFGMQAIPKDRERCIGLLVRALHGEIRDRIAGAIERQEGVRPEAATLPALMEGRDWLFGEYDYYVDTSHLTSLLQYSVEVQDRELLGVFLELCEYGRRLSPHFHYKAPAPFDNAYVDYGHFLRALLGQDVDAQVAHFVRKAEEDDGEWGTLPAQTLVNLLIRLERPAAALEAAERFLADEDPAHLQCPSILQLCHLAGRYDRLQELARSRGDVLSFAAARLEAISHRVRD
jgi:hypothetical protein